MLFHFLLKFLGLNVCQLAGHRDEHLEAYPLTLSFCRECRSLRVTHSEFAGTYTLWCWCPTDAAGAVCGLPYRVLVREDSPHP